MCVRSLCSQKYTSKCCLRWHLDCSFVYLIITICSLVICPVVKSDSSTQEYICSNIDIRNTVAHFSKLQNCTVIEGYLQILLIDKGTVQDYDNLSFPKLREIIGYLLLYRAFGLPSLEILFPNLAVIRGYVLFHNYALVAFEMSQLQEIGLRSLTDILRGSVRIEKNPNLCYIDTIDWDYMAKAGAGGHFFKDNKEQKDCPNTCPTSSNCPLNSRVSENPSYLCWNSRTCQKKCSPECERQNQTCMKNQLSECCHSECLAGCVGKGANECIACRHVVYNGRCMKKCPPNTYEYMGWRCVREDECRNMPNSSMYRRESDNVYWKPFGDKCLPDCPSGFMENNTDRHSCIKCQNRCPKVCHPRVVDNVAAAQALRGCTIIDGVLEIRIQGGTNIIAELEANLKDIQEIKGYLKIARSFPLVSLNFLKGLTTIGGKILHQNDYAFLVLENQNLKDLWDMEYRKSLPRLNITSGKIFFHFNSKLCLSKINDMKKYADLLDWDDRDVSPTSNGDRIACDLTSMNVRISKVAYNLASIKWSNIKNNLTDPRSLLGYVIYYREAPTKNISLFDGHDACGSNVWKVDDVEVGNDTTEEHMLLNLQPYTQYAAYLRTYTTTSAQTGAQSHTIYFRTEPDTPTLPVGVRAHSTTHSEIIIHWKHPKRPNGNVTHYIVEGKRVVESSVFINQRNYCVEPITYSDLKKKTSEEVEINTAHVWFPNSTSDEINGKKCCPCAKESTPFLDSDEDAEFQIHFEDFLHNTVYVKNPKHQGSKNRSRRTIFTTSGPLLTQNHIVSTSPKPENSNSDNITSMLPTFVPPRVNVSDTFSEIVHHNTFLVVSNLHHFTEYTIEVIACQDNFLSNLEPRNDSRRPPCSSKAITTVRTLKLGGADDINSSTIYIKRDNASVGSIYIKWEEPKDPNGLIVSYQIEYKQTNVENFKPTLLCITQLEYQHLNGYILNKMDPGNYSIRLQATSLAGNGNWTLPVYTDIPELTENLSTEIVATIIAIVIVSFVLTFSVCGWVYYQKRYAADLPGGILYTSVNPEYMSAGYMYEPDEWEVPREKISLIRELGQGSFGMVYEGEAKDLEPGKPLIKCAVKTVADNSTVREKLEFLQEASVMKEFSCHHVVKLLGIVAKGHPPLVIMELMANGDLKSYLRFHRPDAEEPIRRQPPTLKRIFQMAVEIADGMAYLATKKFVHRDLAARNCMVAEDLTVKIGDFGMTRDIYETDYYRKGGKGLLPVRWMAPESLKDGVFTSQSDVWSYGIVLWEMATLASQPYQGLSNEQVLKYVINGNIMEKPENCPERLYVLMKLCWARNPKARPTFTELIETLLPDVNQHFQEVSFYFTQRQHICTQQVDNDPTEAATPSTPLKSQSTWDDRSLCSHDNSDEEVDIHFFPSETFMQEENKKSSCQCPIEEQCIDEEGCQEIYGSEEGSKGLSIHSNEGSKGMSLPSSDDSKGSKVSNLSNGSLVNGHIPYPAGRTTLC